jgi:hypothetical protein
MDNIAFKKKLIAILDETYTTRSTVFDRHLGEFISLNLRFNEIEEPVLPKEEELYNQQMDERINLLETEDDELIKLLDSSGGEPPSEIEDECNLILSKHESLMCDLYDKRGEYFSGLTLRMDAHLQDIIEMSNIEIEKYTEELETLKSGDSLGFDQKKSPANKKNPYKSSAKIQKDLEEQLIKNKTAPNELGWKGMVFITLMMVLMWQIVFNREEKVLTEEEKLTIKENREEREYQSKLKEKRAKELIEWDLMLIKNAEETRAKYKAASVKHKTEPSAAWRTDKYWLSNGGYVTCITHTYTKSTSISIECLGDTF